MQTIDSELTIPESNRATSVSTAEAEFMHSLLRMNKFTRTLEVGFAYGYSASYIMDATQANHITIDPYQEAFENLGLRNIEALGFADRLDHRAELSHVALPRLLAEGRTFQFIFIDGGHRFDEIFVDWYFADLLLEKRGYVVLHDSWMRSTQLVAEFVRTNRKDYRYRATPCPNLMLFQKVGARDERSWYHFEEFYTDRSMETHAEASRQLDAGHGPSTAL